MRKIFLVIMSNHKFFCDEVYFDDIQKKFCNYEEVYKFDERARPKLPAKARLIIDFRPRCSRLMKTRSSTRLCKLEADNLKCNCTFLKDGLLYWDMVITCISRNEPKKPYRIGRLSERHILVNFNLLYLTFFLDTC